MQDDFAVDCRSKELDLISFKFLYVCACMCVSPFSLFRLPPSIPHLPPLNRTTFHQAIWLQWKKATVWSVLYVQSPVKHIYQPSLSLFRAPSLPCFRSFLFCKNIFKKNSQPPPYVSLRQVHVVWVAGKLNDWSVFVLSYFFSFFSPPTALKSRGEDVVWLKMHSTARSHPL